MRELKGKAIEKAFAEGENVTWSFYGNPDDPRYEDDVRYYTLAQSDRWAPGQKVAREWTGDSFNAMLMRMRAAGYTVEDAYGGDTPRCLTCYSIKPCCDCETYLPDRTVLEVK